MKLKLEDLIDRAINEAAQDEQPREYIGASIIASDCERALWYGFRWFDSPIFPPRVRRRFETGDTYEGRVTRLLEATGRFVVRTTNPRARNSKQQYAAEYGPLGGLLRGHMDGFVSADTTTWLELGAEPAAAIGIGESEVLLEIKALGSAKYTYHDDNYEHPKANKTTGKTEGRWFELARRGVRKAQQTHFGQLQAYMGMSRSADRNGRLQHEKWGIERPLDAALYIGVNTDTDQWHGELITYDPRWFASIVGRATRVARATSPPPRISENPGAWVCAFCDFHAVCHLRKPAAASCRSCSSAKLKIPGDPQFFGHTATWFCTTHRSGCGDFTACDAYQPITETEEMF